MLKNTALAAVFAGVAALGLTACGDTAPAGPAPQAQDTQGQEKPKDKEAKDAETKAKDAPELKKDVKIVTCEAGAHGGVKATLEVTNSLDKPMEYIGTIIFVDGSGAEIADGLFNTGTLQPGAKATEEIPGANVYTKVRGVTCKVAQVKVDEPA
ncbi:hypothetical protein SAMN05192558_101166 [Actinokineospora alba]|uniref:Lipoprotein antigen n=1 Tax=Actinokineospora alba TaxID=504798 RepID=A0A1H0EZX1_9PSEU|nr:hypothetical protein [Actinokineospora alba]TDP69287.1 hypothetical protein C8E96_4863 [Actinokineospora alba]SDI20170.1 hypothetical protein SAMN05421871_103703 [Actinokineospora alba]SDN87849.1 hypothetical protein SAMN05192558_101166 [Actinokineospora alba]